jgi:hypothetical protein
VERLIKTGKYVFAKHEKLFTLQDLLLSHELPEAGTESVYVGNEVFPPFVPLERSVVMLLPVKLPKPECFDFVMSSLLHAFTCDVYLLSKIMVREVFYRNSVLRGVYFVEEGEVKVASGRIVTRGWITNARGRVSGFGWKFKPMHFMQVIAMNHSVWKNFYNDLELNGELPFNIKSILGLSNDEELRIGFGWRGKKRMRHKHKLPKFPKLTIGASILN